MQRETTCVGDGKGPDGRVYGEPWGLVSLMTILRLTELGVHKLLQVEKTVENRQNNSLRYGQILVVTYLEDSDFNNMVNSIITTRHPGDALGKDIIGSSRAEQHVPRYMRLWLLSENRSRQAQGKHLFVALLF